MTLAELIRIAWDLVLTGGVMLVACGIVGGLIALLDRVARSR